MQSHRRLPHNKLMYQFTVPLLCFLLLKDALAPMGNACPFSARAIRDCKDLPKICEGGTQEERLAKKDYVGWRVAGDGVYLSQLWRPCVGNITYHGAAPFCLLVAFNSLKSVVVNQCFSFLPAPRQ